MLEISEGQRNLWLDLLVFDVMHSSLRPARNKMQRSPCHKDPSFSMPFLDDKFLESDAAEILWVSRSDARAGPSPRGLQKLLGKFLCNIHGRPTWRVGRSIGYHILVPTLRVCLTVIGHTAHVKLSE